MRHHQMGLREFRTPQHPSLGTNNWGGASPLLARNVPKESLEQKYLNLNSIRSRDEIFPVRHGNEDGDIFSCLPRPIGLMAAQEYPPDHPGLRRAAGRGLLSKLMIWPRKDRKAKIHLGSNGHANENGNQKKKWLPRWDPRNRWPQGWC
ncbi:Fe2OG dioxygenase domain-containing protein [Psidium guajava]|nr:Fe2OG dioxygenase domain-containing protein [Psidium guajava]